MQRAYTIKTWPTGYPAKAKARQAGHILNVEMDKDSPNGTLVAVDKYIDIDYYSVKDSTGFKGVLVTPATNGNVRVEVKEPGDALFVYEEPEKGGYESKEMNQENVFYNEKGEVVRAYELHKYDILELSKDSFEDDTVFTEGAEVTVVAGTRKYKAGA